MPCGKYKKAISRIDTLQKELDILKIKIKSCAMCQVRQKLDEQDRKKLEENSVNTVTD